MTRQARRCNKFAVIVLSFLGMAFRCPGSGQRPFTANDDVGLTLFEYAGRPVRGGVIKYSPDSRYFAVVTERGRLDLNSPEDTIWLFRTEDVQRFTQDLGEDARPTPLPLARFANERDGPLIERARWLPDSSAIAFTAVKTSSCCRFHQLFLADVTTHTIRTLTPDDQDVGEFDIRSDGRYVYEVLAPELRSAPAEEQQPAVALTGKSLWTTIFPNLQHRLTPFNSAGLWVVIDGQRRQLLDAKSYVTSRGPSSVSLSPDGGSVVAILKAEHAPENMWRRYKAPPGYEQLRLPLDTSAYHLIDIRNGSKKLLVNAPCGLNQHWNSGFVTAVWSDDGQSLMLPSTFLPLDAVDPSEIADRESHPYIAVLNLRSKGLVKVLALKAGLDKGRYAVKDIRFERDRTLVVDFDSDSSYFRPDQPPAAIFHQQANGSWQQTSETEDPRLVRLTIEVEKRESVNQPPQIVALNKAGGTWRVVWDPNPQLKEVQLGPSEIIHWIDVTGHRWEAGLLKPLCYTPGKRYPLVIQTHGFDPGQFLSSGIYTSAFAARAMAAEGIAVVQMGWNPNNVVTAREAPDQIAGFESVVKKLSEEGVVDPSRVGLIGFSRTVYHVLAAIASGEGPFAAASVTDGVTFGYLEYLSSVDSGLEREADAINGGKPFDRRGLHNWLARSPEFNMDKVQTPLLLLQPGLRAVFLDWEPYAALRYLRKPVDLIMLQAGTHVMTNPTQRLAAEAANVDWFRFWLKGEEDPDPGKAEQYERWRALRTIQNKNEQTSGSSALHDRRVCRDSN